MPSNKSFLRQKNNADDTLNSINVNQYEADVMKEIEDLMQARKDENELGRETTLYDMCDNINAITDQLTKGISIGSGVDGTTASASNSKRQSKGDQFSNKYGGNLSRSDMRESNKRGSERRSFNIFNKERNSALNNSRLQNSRDTQNDQYQSEVSMTESQLRQSVLRNKRTDTYIPEEDPYRR